MADTYDITSISERTKLVQGAGFEEVEDITYRTKPDGLIGTVSIVRRDATPEAVDKAIRDEVDRKHALKHL